MIYCVVPQALAEELYPKLSEYYKDDPNVKVIIDRREGPDRRQAGAPGGQRQTRDRRRPRVTGTFPPVGPPGD